MLISVITPIFHGKKYINGLIQNIERAAHMLFDSIELILISDNPAEIIESKHSNDIDIVTINTDINRGIHGARLYGLSKAKGDFVLFLDQDDVIDDNYFASQLKSVKGHDASICLAYEGNRFFYKDKSLFKSVIRKEEMYGKGNRIISPGQVLIKKDAIPDKWKNTCIRRNGADDFFLWICMINEEKEFVFNEDTFFHHRITYGKNASQNYQEMVLSVREVIEKCNGYLTDEDIQLLEKGDFNRRLGHLKQLENEMQKNNYLQKWMYLRDIKCSIADYFLKKNIDCISIYGLGELGVHLYYELKNKIQIEFLIDREEKIIDGTKTVCFNRDYICDKAIVVASINDIDSIRALLLSRRNTVFILNDIIEKLFESENMKRN